jgi:hypothetical protein
MRLEMQTRIQGAAYVLGDNIDTDQIIPAQYLTYNPSIPAEYKMFGKYALVGVPENCPVDVLNAAHAGLFAIENLSVSPLASVALGRNAYAPPAFTDVAGEPLIVGASFGAEETEIANGASAALALPSLTLITTFV